MVSTTPALTHDEQMAHASFFASGLGQIATVPITMMVVAVCLIVQSSETLPAALEFSHMAGDSIWETLGRMLTGHFTHWSFDQFFWDVLAFAVLGCFCEQVGRARYLALLIASAIAVPLSVMFAHPTLESYRGMSGVDSALFVFLACHIACIGVRNRERTWVIGGLIAWMVFVGKVAFEYVSGNTMFVEATGEFLPLPISHLTGAVVGTLVWAFPTGNIWHHGQIGVKDFEYWPPESSRLTPTKRSPASSLHFSQVCRAATSKRCSCRNFGRQSSLL